MRSVCPEVPGLSPPQVGGPCPPLPHPPVPVGRGPLGATRLPAEQRPRQEQEPGAGAGAGSSDMGSRIWISREPAARSSRRVLIAAHDLPPLNPPAHHSVILIAGYDPPARALLVRPAGRAGRRPLFSAARPSLWPAGHAVRPQAVPLPPGRAAASGAVLSDAVKNIFAACRNDVCLTCRKHFSRTRGPGSTRDTDNRRRAGR